MNRYQFNYTITSTGRTGQFSHVEKTEDEARKIAKTRIADFEFTEESDVIVGELLGTFDATKSYYECEGCSS